MALLLRLLVLLLALLALPFPLLVLVVAELAIVAVVAAVPRKEAAALAGAGLVLLGAQRGVLGTGRRLRRVLGTPGCRLRLVLGLLVVAAAALGALLLHARQLRPLLQRGQRAQAHGRRHGRRAAEELVARLREAGGARGRRRHQRRGERPLHADGAPGRARVQRGDLHRRLRRCGLQRGPQEGHAHLRRSREHGLAPLRGRRAAGGHVDEGVLHDDAALEPRLAPRQGRIRERRWPLRRHLWGGTVSAQAGIPRG
mmetsp:Transcript_71654/g.203315  ORF Transcript_71654/g.203315 Transcript_71654/m.203315 type:complete len:256 (+) Transcript_71654:301-1068(+)